MWRNYVGRGVLPNNVYAIDIYCIEVGLSPCYGGHGVTKYFVYYMPTLCVFYVCHRKYLIDKFEFVYSTYTLPVEDPKMGRVEISMQIFCAIFF